jgi:hypothetical protein
MLIHTAVPWAKNHIEESVAEEAFEELFELPLRQHAILQGHPGR